MNHPKENVFNRWNNVNLELCYCRFEPFGFFVFLGWNLCKISRIRFDSHSLWILKRFFDFSNNFCVRVRVLNRTVRTCYGFTSFWIYDDSNEMRWSLGVTWVLFGGLDRFFDSWLRIFAGKPVSPLSFFFRFGSCEILHLFFFFCSGSSSAITLAARYLRWRARVWIAGTAVQWWRFTTNLWKLLEIVWYLCEFCFCLALWVEFNGEFEVSLRNCSELVLDLS